MAAFWDRTSWRDEYYARLEALTASELTPARAAEQEYSRIEKDTVQQLIKQARRIGDLGCGTGRITHSSVEKFPDKSFLGVDLSQRQLDVYHRRLSPAAQSRIKLACSSISDMRMDPDTLDLALFCNHTFGAILGDERRRSLAAIVDALDPHGLLVIVGFSELALAAECYHNWGMTLVSLDHSSHMVELANHFSLWEPAIDVAVQLAPYGLSLRSQRDFTLGYVQIFELTEKSRAT